MPERARRRQFTAEYKERIVREADACRAAGEVGALLRREGLYSLHLVTWRRQLPELEDAEARAPATDQQSSAEVPLSQPGHV